MAKLEKAFVVFTPRDGRDIVLGDRVNYSRAGQIIETPIWKPHFEASRGIFLARADISFMNAVVNLLGQHPNLDLWQEEDQVDFRFHTYQRINLIEKAFVIGFSSGSVNLDGAESVIFVKKAKVIEEIDLIEALSWLSKQKEPKVDGTDLLMFLVSYHKALAEEDQLRLAQNKDVRIRKGVGSNRNISPEALRCLISRRGKDNWPVLNALALNPAVSEDALLQLSRRISWLTQAPKEAKERIAELSGLPNLTIRVLAEDKIPSVRGRIAAKCSEDVALRIARTDEDVAVLNTLALREDLSPAVFEAIVNNESWVSDFSMLGDGGTKLELIKRSDLPSEVYAKIAEAALLADEESEKGQGAIAVFMTMASPRSCPHTPSKALELLAEDTDLTVFVAEHPNTSHKLYSKIVEELDLSDRLACLGVASSPHLTVKAIEKLIKHRDIAVLNRLFNNPKFPIELLEDLVESEIGEYDWILREISGSQRKKLLNLAKKVLVRREDTRPDLKQRLIQEQEN